MLNRRQLLRTAAALAFCAALAARADRVDDIVRAEMDRQHIPGVAMAVLKDGKILRAEGYGLANLEHHLPVHADTVFKIGSVSKQFIAAGVMLLVEDGRLALDDSVRKHLDDAPAAWAPITIRHLLSHTGGLVRESPAFHPFRAQPDIDLIRASYQTALVFQPGEKYQYSNLGYFTAAEIIRRVSGKPWEEFLEERVFRSLEMRATRTTTMADLVPNRASGYEWQNGLWKNTPEYLALRPSGALLSTVLDLAKWDAALHGDRPFRKETRELLWKDVGLKDGSPARYGLGWTVVQRSGHREVSHGGTLAGFRSHFARFPEDGFSFVVLTNLAGANPAVILYKIAAEYLPGVDFGPSR